MVVEDDRAAGSLHVKAFPEHWIVYVDDRNPHHHLVRHLMVDRGYDRFFHVALIEVPTAQPEPAPA